MAGFACGQSPTGPSEGRPQPAPAQAPKPAVTPVAPSAGPRVLYDARDRAAPGPGVEREPKLPPAIEKAVFTPLSPGYKTKREECGGEDVLVRVTASAGGAFTAPAARETAYLVTSEPCAPAAGRPPATHLLIFEGERLVAHGSRAPAAPGGQPAFLGTELRAVADLDQDGASELLVTSTTTEPATRRETARLYGAKGGTVKLLKELPDVHVDGCGGPSGKVQAQVVRFAAGPKGSPPQVTTETYEAACPANGAPAAADFKPVQPSPSPSTSPSSSTSAR